MKVVLFLIMITTGEPPQQEAIQVESLKVCYEQLGKLLQQPLFVAHTDANVIQAGCAIVQPDTPA